MARKVSNFALGGERRAHSTTRVLKRLLHLFERSDQHDVSDAAGLGRSLAMV